MRVGSLFTGVGGFDIAAERIGMDIAWQSEVDKYCLRVLNERWSDVPQLGSVAEIDAATAGSVEVIVGGSPCQGFSIAGVGMGLDDERSGLFGEMVRLADEVNPTWLVWENVPGALTAGRGADFANVLAALVGSDTPLMLPKHPNGRRSRYAGVAVGPKGVFTWRVLDARHFGVPQRRSRIIGMRTPDTRSVYALLGESELPEYRDAEGTHGSWAAAVDQQSRTEPPYTWRDGPEQPTHVRLRDRLIHDREEYEPFILSEKACRGILERATRRGKTMPPLLELALRLTAGDRATDLDDETLLAALRAVPDDLEVRPEAFRKVRRAASSEDYETWQVDDAGNTLNTFETSDVRATNIAVCYPDPAGNLTERYHKGVNTTFDDGSVVIDVTDGIFVRRLTPRETERLQGFPDDHTKVKGVSNTQRFKQMGNAVAVPVAEWALRRILSVESERAEMAWLSS